VDRRRRRLNVAGLPQSVAGNQSYRPENVPSRPDLIDGSSTHARTNRHQIRPQRAKGGSLVLEGYQNQKRCS